MEEIERGAMAQERVADEIRLAGLTDESLSASRLRHHPADLIYASIARARGIRRPLRALDAARAEGVGAATAMAFLEKETGGWNVWGHDRNSSGQVIWPGGRNGERVLVNEEAYRRYKQRRKDGHGMQGCGPMQLTWWEFQDAADRLGGCWRAEANLRVGYRIIHDLIQAHGYWEAAKRYNGAAAYANDFMAKRSKWRKLLFGRS